ncbi:MAG: lipoyl synthase [Bdellovibrionales bacterium]|nr:lipoyl synthase [Bdellovibrionales bacterium]
MAIDVPRNQQIMKERLVKPPWLKVKAPGSPEYLETKKVVTDLSLHTVCEEAHCPNIGECWSHGTATFMIMGELCTRRCHFCSVKDGSVENLEPLDPLEPHRVGMAIKKLGLKHAVITSVDRDDVSDFGANHFYQTVTSIHRHAPSCKVELLIPDLRGERSALSRILEANVDVLNHNVETVPRLYKRVRPGSGYVRSLSILRWAKEIDPSVRTKSGIMVGLGETRDEVLSLMDDLRDAHVDIMTIGQYLRPTAKQMPVKAFVTPEEFDDYHVEGMKRGFTFVESGALVRSSYHAWKHTDGQEQAERSQSTNSTSRLAVIGS